MVHTEEGFTMHRVSIKVERSTGLPARRQASPTSTEEGYRTELLVVASVTDLPDAIERAMRMLGVELDIIREKEQAKSKPGISRYGDINEEEDDDDEDDDK